MPEESAHIHESVHVHPVVMRSVTSRKNLRALLIRARSTASSVEPGTTNADGTISAPSPSGDALVGAYLESPASPNGIEGVGLALVARAHELPRIVYWGRPLAHPESVIDAYDALRPQRVSGALDETPWPSILPTPAEAWTGSDRLVVRRGGIEQFLHFRLTDLTVRDIRDATLSGDGLDAKHDPGAQDGVEAVLSAADAEQGVRLDWRLQLLPGGLARQSATLVNVAGKDAASASVGSVSSPSSAPLSVERVELGWPLPSAADEILTTTGHHLHERRPQRQELQFGRFEKVATVGRPDFDSTLFIAAGHRGFGFEHGNAFVEHLGWSGNSVLSVERTPYTSGLLGGGEELFGGEMDLEAEQSYSTPWLYGSFGDGLNEASARFHTFVRAEHPRFRAHPRPVLLNTWEAVYFDQNYEKLAALADRAAAAGVERFVVDDGWFLGRHDDTAGLSDWVEDPDTWPEGDHSLKALADTVHAKGMQFGLWFEPEMINPDSETARAHPDWILHASATRLPMQGRTQQVLDLTNPDARAQVFGQMDALVGKLGIDYIKWDHNKLVTEPVSPHSGRPAVHAQVEAVYGIFQELKERHPKLEIESCSSGGGRIDLGILRFADRVWVSDCVDPVEREMNQRYDSVIVPPEILGEHVGKSPADSTGRATSLSLRAAMAFFGHLGVEWDLTAVPDEQVEALGRWIAAYKANRQLFETGQTVHAGPDSQSADGLGAADPCFVDGVVAQDRSRALYRFTQLGMSRTYPAPPVRLPGLDPQALYRVSPLDLSAPLTATGASEGPWETARPIGSGQSDLGWWKSGAVLSGRELIDWGIRPPQLNPEQAVILVAERI